MEKLNITDEENLVAGSLRYIFLISSIFSFVYFNKFGYFNRKIMKWTNSFCIKIISCIFISINYASMGILFTDLLGFYSYLFFTNSSIWCVNVALLYFQHRRKIAQGWWGIRSFWLLNGISYFCKFVVLLTVLNENQIAQIRGLLMLYIIQGSLSMILLYFSIFKPQDNEPGKHGDNFEKITNTSKSDSLLPSDLIAEIDNQGKIVTFKPEIGENINYNELNIIKPFIRIAITEFKTRKYSCKEDKIVNAGKSKIRFCMTITITKRRSMNIYETASLKSEKQFNIKKSLNEVISFNSLILEKLAKIKYVSPLRIQLNNINEIMIMYQSNELNRSLDLDEKQSRKGLFTFDSSVRLSPGKKSINAQIEMLTPKLKMLETTYVNLCRNFYFFLPDFLVFMELRDNAMAESLLIQYEKFRSQFNFFGSECRKESIMGSESKDKLSRERIEEIDEDNEINLGLGNSIHKGNQLVSTNVSDHNKSKNSNNFFIFAKRSNNVSDNNISDNNIYKNLQAEKQGEDDFFSSNDTNSQVNNDLIKTMTFINNIVTNDKYLTIELTSLKENKNLLLSQINFNIILEHQSDNFVSVSVKLIELLNYCDNKRMNKSIRVKELKSLLSDTKSILQLKREKSQPRRKMNIALTGLVNDLFYLDSELFHVLQINKILNLEINEIDPVIFNSFFDLDRKSSLNTHLFASHILKEKNILNYRIVLDFLRIEKLETMGNTFYIVIFYKVSTVNLTQKDSSGDISTFPDDSQNWEVEIKIEDLKSLFDDIISINSSMNRFYELSQNLSILRKKIECLINYIKNNSILKKTIDKNQRESIISTEKKTDMAKTIDEITILLNNLFVPPNIYILYSETFRTYFDISLLFQKKKESRYSSSGLIEATSEDQILSNSNKSILENLLN